jgi:predicted MFS family arabinose efflux permease
MTRPEPSLSPRLVAFLAAACGLIVANLYYSQALVGQIAPAIGLRPGASGLIVTATQLGYGAGLFLLVPLADLVENRRLVLALTAGAGLASLGLWASRSADAFIILSFLTGLSSVGAQVMVPMVAHFTPDAQRGRVVGNVMGGLIAGIMLARPAANAVAAVAGWRAIYLVGALSMAALLPLMARALPARAPRPGLSYGALLRSGIGLLVRTPVVRRRTAYQALMFTAFNLFWTAIPLVLSERFGLRQGGIALFALAGAGGALAAPIGGRLGDRGHGQRGTVAALLAGTLAFAVAGWAVAAGALLILAVAAVVLDGAVQLNQVLGQRQIYAVAPEARGRINAVYMTVVFAGGATGSLLASLTFHAGGWTATACTGAAITVAALALFLTEPREA